MSTNATELLDLAREILEGRLSPIWARIVPVVARQALEQCLFDYWPRRGFEGIASTSMRCQLICLREYGPDPKTAQIAGHVWWTLSRASHHRPYETSPSWEEIDHWLEQVAAVIGRLDPPEAGR